MKKRLISAALGITTFIMSLPQLTLPASAASTPAISEIRSGVLNLYDDSSKTGDESVTYIALDGTEKTALKSSDITDTAEGWSWNASTATLTLNGATICDSEYALILPANATIYLSGANTVRSTTKSATVSSAIYSSGALTIKGDGSLYAGAAQSSELSTAISTGGKLTVGSGSDSPYITAYSDPISAVKSYGISCGGLEMKSGLLTAVSGLATQVSCGVYSSGTVTVRDGRFNTSGNYAPSSYGVSADKLAIYGGTSVITGGVSTSESAGVSAAVVENNGGTLVSTGGTGTSSYGIKSAKITFNDGLTVSRSKSAAVSSTPSGTVGLIGGSESGITAVYGDSSTYKVATSALNFKSGNFSSKTLENDGYTFSNNTLTLKNLVLLAGGSTAITLPQNVTVKFEGVSYIQSSSGTKTYGILSEPNTTFSGSGTLISVAGASSGESYGILDAGTLTCESGELIGIGGATTANSTGIAGGSSAAFNGGKITSISGEASLSRSLYAPVMTIGKNGSGPEILAMSGNCTSSSDAIYINNDGTLKTYGGRIMAVALPVYSSGSTTCYGISAENGFTAENTNIMTASGNAAFSIGLYSEGDVNIKDSTLLSSSGYASTMSGAVYATPISFSETTANLSSGNSEGLGFGIYSYSSFAATGGNFKTYVSSEGASARSLYGVITTSTLTLSNVSAAACCLPSQSSFGLLSSSTATMSNSVIRATGKYASYFPSNSITDMEVIIPSGGKVNGYIMTSSGTYSTDALIAPAADLTYNLNYSGAASAETKTYVKGTNVTIAAAPTRNGFNFLGWATSSTGDVIYHQDEKLALTADITLYAVWEQIAAAETYTVTYNLNGGSGTAPTDSNKYESGSSVTVTSTTPTRSGYVFAGWATSANGSIAYTSGSSFKITANVTLYAVWEQESTISNRPEGLKAVSGCHEITLSWNEVYGASGYIVKSADGTVQYTPKAITTTTYTVTGLKNGTQYQFRVYAYVDKKWYTSSKISKTPTGAPQNVNATAASHQVTLTWEAVDGATGYIVKSADGAVQYTSKAIKTNSYTVTGLTNSTQYKFKVYAYSDGKWFASSTATKTPTGAPQNVTATAGSKKITLAWNSVDGATGYIVKSADGTIQYTTKAIKTNSYTVTGLTGGTQYKFKIYAYVDGKWWGSSTVTRSAKA